MKSGRNRNVRHRERREDRTWVQALKALQHTQREQMKHQTFREVITSVTRLALVLLQGGGF